MDGLNLGDCTILYYDSGSINLHGNLGIQITRRWPTLWGFGLNTTRGDRLFISLLGSGFIHIFWLGLTDLPLWGASIVAVVYAIFVFRKV